MDIKQSELPHSVFELRRSDEGHRTLVAVEPNLKEARETAKFQSMHKQMAHTVCLADERDLQIKPYLPLNAGTTEYDWYYGAKGQQFSRLVDYKLYLGIKED